jgi:16S rRNA (cytosine967-C5)-methyltransferase
MHVGVAEVRLGDAAQPELSGGGYDRVLVDPPCSGLGTLQSRPDIRWRTSPDRIAELAPLQARILRAGATATGPGGVLVYSVCTISRAESEDVVDRFLEEDPSFRAEPVDGTGATGPYRLLTPVRDGTDGFFIARLRRR